MGTPLIVETGLFVGTSGWSSAPSASSSSGDKSVEITEHGISVESPVDDSFFPLTGNISHMFFGSDEYLLILTESTAVGPVDRRVSVVDFTDSHLELQNILDVVAGGFDVPLPVVQHSRGTGSAFLIYASDGTVLRHLAIHRSDNGEVLCSVIPPIDSEGDVRGEATDSEVIINYVTGGRDRERSCDLPRGSLVIDPPSHTFEAVIGGPPDRATHTQDFTLDNEGTDYVIVQSIGEVSPFSVTTSTPLPEDPPPREDLTVQVTFEPTAVGHYEEELPIETLPDLGSLVLVCVGEAREAAPRLRLSSDSFDFGRVPVDGGSRSEHVYIYNDGEADLDVSWGTSPPGSAFQWEGGSETISPDGDRIEITIDFDPVVSGRATATLTVESNDPDSPHEVDLVGMGCVPRAEIRPPSTAPISFGEVQRGFRMVRFFTIRNTGTGRLTFRAHIEGADATLFGLQPPSGSVYDVLNSRDYSVNPNPAVACGDPGEGVNTTNVAVAFHAGADPGTVGAELVIYDHNASIAPDLPLPAEFRIPLQAEIIEVESADAALVLDRSGSMEDPLGSRRKIDAAIDSAQLFIQLLRPGVGDRLAIIRYNQEANAIVPITEIEDEGTKDDISREVNPTNLDPSGSTAIAGGIIVGRDQLAEPRPSPPIGELSKPLVVLTDGKDNTAYQDPDDSRWYSILGGETNRPDGSRVDTTPVSIPADVQVYGIGLGRDEDVDIGRLGVISEVTGASFRVTGDLLGSTYFQLEKYFTEIYMDVASEELLLDPVYTIAPNEQHRIGFDVLRGDVRTLVVIYDRDGLRLPFHLETPKGERIEVTTLPPGFQLRGGATPTARFLEVRMPQGEPDRYAGHWNVVVSHTGEAYFGTPHFEHHGEDEPTRVRRQEFGFVPSGKNQEWDQSVDYGVAIGVGSNFRMRPFLTLGIVQVGDPILLSAVVTEAGLPVTGCTMTVKIVSPSSRVEYLTLHDSGVHDDGDADDAEYANYFTHTGEAGSYEFTFRAEGMSRDGEPVVREATRAKYVEGRLPIAPDPRNLQRVLHECCRRLTWLLIASVVLLLFVIFLLLMK